MKMTIINICLRINGASACTLCFESISLLMRSRLLLRAAAVHTTVIGSEFIASREISQTHQYYTLQYSLLTCTKNAIIMEAGNVKNYE